MRSLRRRYRLRRLFEREEEKADVPIESVDRAEVREAHRIAYAILGPIADANIDVDVIVQNVGHDGMTDMTFTVGRADYARAVKILNEKVKPQNV